ncbi:MAG: AmmeMemoRadiSam system protein B [Candidatus Dojkabacteria bacterium]|nr:AmmeMemoRadiSam system protein B [Candidatus Dojkabacteria bacterium]
MMNIRPPAFAGSFYPEDEEELKKCILKHIHEANPEAVPGQIKALISPHAGYEYSGPVAAFGYKLLHEAKNQYTSANVQILGPSHKVMFSNIALTSYTFWRTPLGIVALSPLSNKLKEESDFSLVNEAHLFEHSIEVQLPFLQSVLDEFKITPLATGRVNDHKEAAYILNDKLDANSLIIASSDLSHYLPYRKAQETDKETIDNILAFDSFIEPEQACGVDGILILNEIAKMNNWKAKLLDYRNSGDTSGDKQKVVGYASIVYYEE